MRARTRPIIPFLENLLRHGRRSDILPVMMGTSQRLAGVRDLLERALDQIDALDDTYLGVLIDTALQDVTAKIEASKAVG